MMRRIPRDDSIAPRRSGALQGRPTFIAMVIAEWHKLIADISRAFARKRLHRSAAESQEARARVKLLRTSGDKFPS